MLLKHYTPLNNNNIKFIMAEKRTVKSTLRKIGIYIKQIGNLHKKKQASVPDIQENQVKYCKSRAKNRKNSGNNKAMDLKYLT